MTWVVIFDDDFEREVASLTYSVQNELFARAGLLAQFGPRLNRPWADTLKGSAYANMKELRFDADGGVWRVAFAFDPERQAILLVAGDKSGVSEKRFYRQLIDQADKRFSRYLTALSDKR